MEAGDGVGEECQVLCELGGGVEGDGGCICNMDGAVLCKGELGAGEMVDTVVDGVDGGGRSGGEDAEGRLHLGRGRERETGIGQGHVGTSQSAGRPGDVAEACDWLGLKMATNLAD